MKPLHHRALELLLRDQVLVQGIDPGTYVLREMQYPDPGQGRSWKVAAEIATFFRSFDDDMPCACIGPPTCRRMSCAWVWHYILTQDLEIAKTLRNVEEIAVVQPRRNQL